MKFDETIKTILNEGKKPWKKGESIDYHGREGEVVDYEGGGVIVYFPDVDEEEWIDIDELIDQN